MRNFTPLDIATKIANGTARSAAIAISGRVRGVTIVSPATLPETVNLEISIDGGTTYGVLQSGGVDVVLGAGKSVVLDYAGFSHVRYYSSSGNVGADRVFQIGIVEEL